MEFHISPSPKPLRSLEHWWSFIYHLPPSLSGPTGGVSYITYPQASQVLRTLAEFHISPIPKPLRSLEHWRSFIYYLSPSHLRSLEHWRSFIYHLSPSLSGPWDSAGVSYITYPQASQVLRTLAEFHILLIPKPSQVLRTLAEFHISPIPSLSGPWDSAGVSYITYLQASQVLGILPKFHISPISKPLRSLGFCRSFIYHLSPSLSGPWDSAGVSYITCPQASQVLGTLLGFHLSPIPKSFRPLKHRWSFISHLSPSLSGPWDSAGNFATVLPCQPIGA